MEIHYLTGEAYSRWDAYVDSHAQGTLYHKSVWKGFFEDYFKKPTFYIYVSENDTILGILPIIKVHSFLFGKSLVSFPHFDYGGLLASSDRAQNLLLEEGKKILEEQKSDELEIRMDQLMSDCSLKYKTKKISYILDLPETPELFQKQLKGTVRNRSKRPGKEGMYVKIGKGELLDSFYRVFAVNMRDLGTPVYAKSFFKHIMAAVPENFYITVVFTKNHKPAAASFCLCYKDKVEIPWVSSLRKYNKFSTNTCLYFNVISEAISRGFKRFDFGRCTKGGNTDRFKKNWKPREVQLYWYYIMKDDAGLPEDMSGKSKYQLAVKMWSKLPVWLTKIMGPPLIKHLNS